MKITISDHFDLKKLLRYSLSPISMMVFSSLYSIADGIMVSNAVGKNAMAATNIIWPMIMIIGSVGFMLGSGGSAEIAKTLGEKDEKKANEIFSFLILVIIVAGVILSFLAISNLRSLSYLFGASDVLINECMEYGTILLSCTTMFMIQCAFENYCSTAGKPSIGFISTISSGVVNIVLDYLFIMVYGWGIKGAAIATGLGYSIGAIIPLLYFLFPNNSLLRLGKTKFYFKELINSCTNGISEMLTNVSSSFVVALFNVKIMAMIGEDGVSAYSMIAYTDYVFKSILLGISIATGPIISYNFGANNYSELKNVYKMTFKIMAFFSILMFALGRLSAPLIAKIFVSDDPQLCLLTENAMRIYSTGYSIVGINIFASSFFTALCNGKLSGIISATRSFILPVLFINILADNFGIDGVWFTNSLSEISCFILSITFIYLNRKKYHYN